jgi:hypothetical protein
MKKTMLAICFIAMQSIIAGNAAATNFQCEKVFSSSLQVSNVKHCNSSYVNNLPNPKKIGRVLFNNALFFSVLKNNNLGAVKILFRNGERKTVYRSAYLAGSPLCIHALSKRKIQTVVNLYSGHLGYAAHMHSLEAAIFKANGVRHYLRINNYMVDALRLPQKKLNNKIANIIKKIITAKGNVLIHCYTGEHDTGVIFGVLNKCLNKQSPKAIQENTSCHMGHTSKYGQKTYLRVTKIIRHFPCSLLHK